MKSGISFQERAKLGMELLSKQRPITLEIALEQKRRIEARRSENFNILRFEKVKKIEI